MQFTAVAPGARESFTVTAHHTQSFTVSPFIPADTLQAIAVKPAAHRDGWAK